MGLFDDYATEVKEKKEKKEKKDSVSKPVDGGVTFVNTALPDVLELKNINQTYNDGQIVVFNNLNLLVEDKPGQGQFLCLLGTSGCGKSTILRYICGLQEPTSGEVLVYGKPRTHENRVGMVFQQYSSLPWYTVYENVELPLKYQGIEKAERNERVQRVIDLVGLSGHENKYAQYPTLSGGQLQRVAIARSIVAKPDILVMDEPFGALDIRTRLQMQDLLAKIWSEMETTIVFVTHDISEAAYLGDDIFIMRANPGQFIYYHHVELPLKRTREIKRSNYFNSLVYQIEDEMMELDSLSRKEKQ